MYRLVRTDPVDQQESKRVISVQIMDTRNNKLALSGVGEP